MLWDSFFDDEASTRASGGYTIWKKLDGNSDPDPPANQVLFEGYMLKTDSKSNTLKERFFVLTREKLFYKKVSGFFDGRRSKWEEIRVTSSVGL